MSEDNNADIFIKVRVNLKIAAHPATNSCSNVFIMH